MAKKKAKKRPAKKKTPKPVSEEALAEAFDRLKDHPLMGERGLASTTLTAISQIRQYCLDRNPTQTVANTPPDIALEAARLFLSTRDIYDSEFSRMSLAEVADELRKATEEEEGPWSKADYPKQWAKKFGVTLNTFNSIVAGGKIRVKKLTSKSIQIHVDDVPVD